MKVTFTPNADLIDSNGDMKVPAAAVKKAVEDTAQAAYKTGKVEGWCLGGLFATCLYVAADAICAFIRDDSKAAK